MSRNVQNRQPSTPVKKASKRRGSDSSSSLNLSDENGYSGVEDVSDSEDDDEAHVFAAEEEHIIARVSRKGQVSSPRSHQDDGDDADSETEDGAEDADEEDDGGDEDEDEEDEGSPNTEDEDNGYGCGDNVSPEKNDTVAAVTRAQEPSAFIMNPNVISVERHVRFTGVPDSDSDSTTTDTTEGADDFFPDLFVEQSSLDPAFRREIEHDPDDSSNSSSFWDFHNTHERLGAADSDDDMAQDASDEENPPATPASHTAPGMLNSTLAHDVQDSDGYETDGDTTEEESLEAQPRRKQTRHHSFDADDDILSDSDRERSVQSRKGQPRVAKFNLDRSGKKPVAVLNPITRKMMIFTPQRLQRFDLSPESFALQYLQSTDALQASPILSHPASLMMSAMVSSNTFGDFMNSQPVGPTEAFFPLTSDAITADDSEESGEMNAKEDNDENNLRLDDFITFNHDDDSDDEQAVDTTHWADGSADVACTPTRKRGSAGAVETGDTSDYATDAVGVHPLLNHFENNSDAVGAFRRNQVNQQLILSDRATQDSLAFSSPFHHGTLRGIKSGSLETVTAPISPMRRQKKSGVAAPADYSKSPLRSTTQKRKASQPISGVFEHKRHRSISDMNILQI